MKHVKKWVKILYSQPQAKVLVNHTLTDTLLIGRSVRQGDPLSSLLYILTLEPLLTQIRQDKHIKGITLPGGKEQKLLGFADDANFFPTNYKSIRGIF